MSKKIVTSTLLFLCVIPCIASAAFKLPDTGQTMCYNTSGTIIPCTGTGQDGAYNINPMSYTDSSSVTVTDNNIGLMWQKQDDGNTYNWAQASGVCDALVLGDHDDWRLPTKKELISIVDYSVPFGGPTINSTYFPGTQPIGNYWSSSDYKPVSGEAWGTTFISGSTGPINKGTPYYVRCVRGDQPAQSFTSSNGMVTDSRTGLIWQQGEPGTMSWANALSYCQELPLAGYEDWRLPNIKELESLTDDTRSNPAINTLFSASAANYWSSSTNVYQPGVLSWVVNFNNGAVGYENIATLYNVRCVRGGHGVTNDFDGDVKIDIAVFRPTDGKWYIIDSSTNGQRSVNWGQSGDIPVPGDYDGDRKTDTAVFRPTDGKWYIIDSSTNGQRSVNWGQSGDIPVPGDYDSDGKTDSAVFRPTDGKWYIIDSSTGGQRAVNWGQSGDIPVPGDYDSDSKTDTAVFRPTDGKWYIIDSSTGGQRAVNWGQSGDIPVPGDYDSDGKTDTVVFRPTDGKWYIIDSSTNGQRSVNWGQSGDIPVPGDYDSDGKTDTAVFRPTDGKWYIIDSSTGGQRAVQWGGATDLPVNQQPLPPITIP